ncbi:hypothetical protein FBU30_004106 [Linnemannia zychae]|nr:hypothetical protein FBU30_004106 [Linnemannia zychae]
MTSMDRVLSLPELVSSIIVYLTSPDLACCILVSWKWNNTFIPSLWHIIKDTRYSWRKMAPNRRGYYDRINHKYISPDQLHLTWIEDVIKKHSHHIRHLSISSCISTSLVSKHYSLFKGLKTLWIHIEHGYITDKVLSKAHISEELDKVETALLSGIVQPGAKFTSISKNEWTMVRRLWLLILQAPQLCNLKPSTSNYIKLEHKISPIFFCKALAVHHKTLTSVQIWIDLLDVETYLEVLPNLQHLYVGHASRSGYHPVKAFRSNKLYPLLRTLFINKPMTLTMFYHVLDRFPGLEHFGVAHIQRFDDMTNQPSKQEEDHEGEIWGESTDLWLAELSSFKNTNYKDDWGDCNWDNSCWTSNDSIWNAEEDVAMDMLPNLSNLTVISIDAGYPNLSSMIAKYCQKLQVFRNSDGCETIFNCEGYLNEVSSILESCPDLRIFDAIDHLIEADYLVGRSWVCKDLELFRCQLIGFSRPLNREDEEYLSAATTIDISGYESLPDKYKDLIDKHLRCQRQHIEVYDRLATLTQLTTLDLGHEFYCPDDYEYDDDFQIVYITTLHVSFIIFGGATLWSLL